MSDVTISVQQERSTKLEFVKLQVMVQKQAWSYLGKKDNCTLWNYCNNLYITYIVHCIKTRRKHGNVNFCPHLTSDNCVILFALLKFAYRLRHRAFTTSWFCGNPGTWLPKIGLKSVMPSVSVSSKCLWRTQVTSELYEMRNRSN